MVVTVVVLFSLGPQVVPPESSSATSSLPASVTDNTVPLVDSATVAVASECVSYFFWA